MLPVTLEAANLHWMPNVDPVEDCCVHGNIYLQVGEKIISPGDEDWTLSTTAFNFLRSAFHNHRSGQQEALIPCCGFNMWPMASQPDGLYIPNCSRGIDWNIEHAEGLIIHELPSGERLETTLQGWTVAVCRFADEIYHFFQTAWPKRIRLVEDRKGFELFMKLWQERRDAAQKIIDAG